MSKTTVKNNTKKFDIGQLIKWLSLAVIVVWPFINTFWGVDIADTGFHVLNFNYMFTWTENVSYATLLTSLFGKGWLSLFGGLGIWGLNLFEVLLEWGLIAMLYPILKKHLGQLPALVGSALSIALAGTYFNVMNYHQLSMFFLGVICVLIYWALTLDKWWISVLSGVALGLAIFVRFPNLTMAMLALGVPFYALAARKRASFSFRHIGSEILGLALCLGGGFLLLKVVGLYDSYLNSVLYLGDLSQSSGSYNTLAMAVSFFRENLKAISFGFSWILFSSFAAISAELLFRRSSKDNKQRRALHVIVACISVIMAGLLLYISAREVGRDITFPQMTWVTFLLVGVQYIASAAVIVTSAFGKTDDDKKLSLLALMGLFFPPLMIIGSNVGVKHTIMGFWISFPITIYAVMRMFAALNGKIKLPAFIDKAGELKHLAQGAWLRRVMAVCVLVSLIFTLDMSYKTNNFDDYDRTKLRYSVDSPNVKLMYTTQTEAESINGVLKTIRKFSTTDDRLLVYGNAMLLHYLTDMQPFVRRPWITVSSYPAQQFLLDFEKSAYIDELGCPVIVEAMINTYGGFKMSDYPDLRRAMDYGEKRTIQWRTILEFARANRYIIVYSDAYFTVRIPASMYLAAGGGEISRSTPSVTSPLVLPTPAPY